MSQAPIAVNGKEVIDLSLRNCIREPLTKDVKLSMSMDSYVKLLEFVGKTPVSVNDTEEDSVLLKCKAKYRYTYTIGSHMTRHADTIKGDTHIGTLVLVKERAIQGGELIIDYEDEEPEFFCYISNYDHVDVIPLGVYHEITPVEEGTRITEVYEIHVDKREDLTDRVVSILQKDLLQLQCLSLLESITTCDWNTSLIKKYTKDNQYVAFPLNPDPIESLILKMILDVTGVKEYRTGIVCVSDNYYSYNDKRCTIIGSLDKEIHSYCSYNDEGYDTYSYRIANIIEIPHSIEQVPMPKSVNSISQTDSFLFDSIDDIE